MRIVIVAVARFPNDMGPVRRVEMIGKGLLAAGHEVHIAGWRSQAEHVTTTSLDGLIVHWGRSLSGPADSSLLGRLAIRSRILQDVSRVGREGLDWIIFYNMGIDALPLAMIARYWGSRIATDNCDWRYLGDLRHPVALIRGLSFSLANSTVLPMSSLNLVVSEYLERQVRRCAPRTPLFTIPALVDTSRFARDEDRASEFRRRWSLGGEPIVAYLGGSQRFEGLATLLRACRVLKDRGMVFKVVLATPIIESEFYDDIPALIAELDLATNVLLTGILATDDVVAAMSAADILVVPKALHVANEAGFPQKLAEYLSIGRAVLTTRVGDIPRYLDDGIHARLCEPDSVEDMARVLGQMLIDPDLRERLAHGAREAALRSFDTVRIGKALAERLEHLR